MDQIQKNLLAEIAGLHEVPAGAYNFRVNGIGSYLRNCLDRSIVHNNGITLRMSGTLVISVYLGIKYLCRIILCNRT